MSRRYTYLTCCVNSVARLIDEMTDQAREITYAHARRLIDPAAWRDFLNHQGYRVAERPGSGIPLSQDYAVRYFTSRYRGRRCCYIVHSAIEYIFT